MDAGFNREFRFLDTEAERQQLVDDIRRVRQSVVQLAENMPPDRWYEPRYHGWSLAAMLAHLHTIDNAALWGIRLALLGIRLPIALTTLDGFNNFTARIFQRRVVPTTIRGIRRREDHIANLIMTLPIDRFTREIYYPPGATYLTIEQALQQLFLYHWQEHLQTMQRVEGIYYEPPKSSAEI